MDDIQRLTLQFSSVTQLCLTLCNPMDCSTPGFPIHHQLPELTQTHVHRVSDAIQPSHPLLSPSPPASIFPSIRVFSNESVLHSRWPKYWSFIFSISSSNEYSGLISFRIDWFGLPAVQGTIKSLLQYHSLQAPILNFLKRLTLEKAKKAQITKLKSQGVTVLKENSFIIFQIIKGYI